MSDRGQQCRRTIAIPDVGGVDHGADQQSTGIGDDMALAPLDQLGRIEAPDIPAFRGFHGLAVDHAGRRAGLASRRFTRGHEKVMVESAQRSVGTPSIEVTLDRTARRELPRQHPPLAARARHVQDRVQHLAQVSRLGPAMPFASGKVRGNHFPFLVRQVACVTQARPLIPGRVISFHILCSLLCLDTNERITTP